MAGDVSIAEAVGRAVGCAPSATGPSGQTWPAISPKQIQRHRVGALLRAAGFGAPGTVPEAARIKLALDADRARQAAAAAVALQQELIPRLKETAVPVLVLKGPSVALRAHGDVVRRHVGDLDLLIDPRHAARATAVLGAAGFVPTGLEFGIGDEWRPVMHAVLGAPHRYPLLKAVSLRRSAGEHVELHWRLFRNDHLLPVDPAWLTTPARIDIAGSETPVLPLEVLWRYLLVHGAVHRWFRLKWLADVPALALRHPELLSPSALRTVEGAGLARSAAGSLLLAEQVLGRFLPDGARSWARSVRGTRPLRHGSLVALRRDDRLETMPVAELPCHLAALLLLRSGGRYRRAEVRRLLLEADRAHAKPDPGPVGLVRGPGLWVTRNLHRDRSRARR